MPSEMPDHVKKLIDIWDRSKEGKAGFYELTELFDDALVQKERIVRGKLLKKIEDIIGEFSDSPDECLGIISDFVERRLYLLRNGHSIDVNGNCNQGCC